LERTRRSAEALRALPRGARSYGGGQQLGLVAPWTFCTIDQDNPDDLLLLLQLACRARELGLANAP
jgi:hypothetical protein